jgi:hypothetical protein
VSPSPWGILKPQMLQAFCVNLDAKKVLNQIKPEHFNFTNPF